MSTHKEKIESCISMPNLRLLVPNFILTLLILIFLAILGARLSYSLNPIKADYTIRLPSGVEYITAKEAQKLDALWVDARSSSEFKNAHIPGAVSLKLASWDDEFIGFIKIWRPGKVVVVYCDGGACQLSAEVAEKLKRAIPQANVKVLKGGYPEWQGRL